MGGGQARPDRARRWTDYVKAVRKADLAEKGDEDVFRKLRKDFDDKGVRVSDAELRKAMADFLAKAVSQIEAERKASCRLAGRVRASPVLPEAGR